jgi:hypothetical protein
MPTHPLISLYGHTLTADFPLLLIIGREPNNHIPMDDTIGPYNFREVPRCAFWNTAYSTAAWTVGMTARDLKLRCETAGASPIAFADILSLPIPNYVADKASLRNAILPADANAHIDRTFSHSTVIRRVALCLLSGLSHPSFTAGAARARGHCVSAGVPCADIPFLYGTNTARIRAALVSSGCDCIRAVMTRFLAA